MLMNHLPGRAPNPRGWSGFRAKILIWFKKVRRPRSVARTHDGDQGYSGQAALVARELPRARAKSERFALAHGGALFYVPATSRENHVPIRAERKRVSVFRKLGLAGALTLACAAQFGGQAQPTQPAAKAAAMTAAGRWAHQTSDLKADPRHPLRHPAQRHALRDHEESRLRRARPRCGCGSTPARWTRATTSAGLAHFLEHMVFNGTTNVPEGEFVRRLERHGLRFGPDTNASTGFDADRLHARSARDRRRDRRHGGLFLLREVAGEATLDSGRDRVRARHRPVRGADPSDRAAAAHVRGRDRLSC